jgi:hypothetical protein
VDKWLSAVHRMRGIMEQGTSMSSMPLEYSPRLSWHRRRKVRARILLISFVILVAGFTALAPKIWRRARILYYQHQCLVYSAPPDTVVYEPDPTKAALQIQKHRGMEYWGTHATPEYAIAANPACLKMLTSLLPPPGVLPMSGVGFMHELRNHRGDRRLVIVSIPQDFFWTDYVIAPITEPFGQIATGTDCSGSLYDQDSLTGNETSFRIFAGQLDESDPSHFTFAYESADGKGIIDGRLTENCDVEMHVRSGPAVNLQPRPLIINSGSNPIIDGGSELGTFNQRVPMGVIDDRPR